MEIASYSRCRLQYRANDARRPEINYSDRTVIELRQHDYADYSLRAVDIDNNRTEIFNIPLRKPDQYKIGAKNNQPDEIQSIHGTYFLWLNTETRNQFIEALNICIEQLQDCERRSTNSDSLSSEIDANDVDDVSSNYDDNDNNSIQIADAVVGSPQELLSATHNLSKHIAEGDKDAAARLASTLTSQNVRLHAQPLVNHNDEQSFRINVQIDGDEYSVDQNGGTVPLDVYRFTTVRELRATFEITYHYSPTNQYFFVNGRLAHDNETMKDLNVGPNSLFILFFLAHPRTFRKTGPWKCSACNRNNDQCNLRCHICAALRTD